MADSAAEADVHGNGIACFLSALLIGVFYAVSLFIKKSDTFLARKILHIGVSNWAFIYMYVFDDKFLIPLSGLLVMAFVNLIVGFADKASGRDVMNVGTVEYPLIMALFLVLRKLSVVSVDEKLFVNAFSCALLGMGYGDGFAAVIGRKYGKLSFPFRKDKTVTGALVMFFWVFVFIVIIMKCSLLYALIISAIAVIAEVYTPCRQDNITVPSVIFFLTLLLC